MARWNNTAASANRPRSARSSPRKDKASADSGPAASAASQLASASAVRPWRRLTMLSVRCAAASPGLQLQRTRVAPRRLIELAEIQQRIARVK